MNFAPVPGGLEVRHHTPPSPRRQIEARVASDAQIARIGAFDPHDLRAVVREQRRRARP